MGVIETLLPATTLAGVVGTGIGASYACNDAVMDNAALLLAVLIGLHNIPEGMAVSLPLISGAMLYVVFGEILPQSILMYHSKLPVFSTIVGILVGLLVIFA